MPTSILIATAFASGCVTTCLIRPEAKEPAITGYYVTYEAQLIGGAVMRGDTTLNGYPLRWDSLTSVASRVRMDTNVIHGSVIILNAIPLQ